MSQMTSKQIFNPEGNDSPSDIRMIGGNPTNLINLSDKRYSWTKEMMDVMIQHTWFPHIISLTKDAIDYQELNKDEMFAYDRTLSFLTFLDSIQTINIPRVGEYITASDVVTCLTVQAFQESIHNLSYSHIIDSTIPKDKRTKIYEYWKEDEILFKRNKSIASIYQDFSDNKSKENFIKVILANYALEGVYFYNGFMFFYNMAQSGKLMGVQEQIQLINRDERTHVSLFARIILELENENKGLISNDLIQEVIGSAVESEISWAKYAYGNRILGISEASTEHYTKYLANERLKMIGRDPMFTSDKFDMSYNPYAHLELLQDDESTRVNFFESNALYSQASGVKSWDF